jgi:hypothetical protein
MDLVDMLDPTRYTLTERQRGDVAKYISEYNSRSFVPGGGEFGLREAPRADISGSQITPVPPTPSLPGQAREVGAGIIGGATLGVVDLPHVEDETPSERIMRGIGFAIGLALPYAAAAKVAGTTKFVKAGERTIKESRRLIGGKTYNVRRMGIGAGVAAAETEVLDLTQDVESSNTAKLIYAGLGSLFFRTRTPQQVQEGLGRLIVRESSVMTRYRKLPETWKRLNPKDFPEKDREMIRGFNGLHKHITPGEINSDELARVAKLARKGERIPDDYVVTPIDTPRLKKLVDGLEGAELDEAMKYYGPAEGMGEFHIGSFGRVVAGRKLRRAGAADAGARSQGPVKETSTRAASSGEASEAETIAAARIKMESEFKPALGAAGQQTATRQNKYVAQLERKAQVEEAQGRRGKPVSGASEGPPEGAIKDPQGREYTVDQALRKRGPVPTAHGFEEALELKSTKMGSLEGPWQKRYLDADGNRVADVTYVRKGHKEYDQYFPGDANTGDIMIIEFEPAPGWSQAIMMEMVHREGATFVKAAKRTGTRGLSHRLGARSVQDFEDIVRFGNVGKKK